MRIDRFTEEALGIELLPWQREHLEELERRLGVTLHASDLLPPDQMILTDTGTYRQVFLGRIMAYALVHGVSWSEARIAVRINDLAKWALDRHEARCAAADHRAAVEAVWWENRRAIEEELDMWRWNPVRPAFVMRGDR